MRLVVLAYQEIGYVSLEALLRAGADVALVLSHEDDPGEEVWYRSVKGLAEAWGIPVLCPEDPNGPEILETVREIAPDFIFSFYYRYMLSADLLGLARKGAYNLHGSLLPRYRGRAPANWVLVNGESETGVSLHRMTPRPDDGPLVAQARVEIAETDTVRELYVKMAAAAASLMADVWPRMAAGDYEEVPQDKSRASYFGRRRPEDGRIDWAWEARRIYNLCRAVTHPYPGAFTEMGGRRLFIWSGWYEGEASSGAQPGTVLNWEPGRGLGVACGRGIFYIRSAQWAGGAETDDLSPAGLNLASGSVLGEIQGESN